ncbi:hypothetical protein GE061_005014 [Apolygus lucorum]|uniref:FCH domain-containing protein n=1 Tax=Apolygus lucorum TaxID=248454 RepID=A0A8S9WWT6_APOLU|nr:hypothetical protein GE061_005014 [Apolygus lucorum]
MQPPPRKGNYAKFLKNLHSEQVAKLQLKNQNECDLLEDVRNFILKRSAIEKSYAEVSGHAKPNRFHKTDIILFEYVSNTV